MILIRQYQKPLINWKLFHAKEKEGKCFMADRWFNNNIRGVKRALGARI